MADELFRAMLWLYKSGGLFFFFFFAFLFFLGVTGSCWPHGKARVPCQGSGIWLNAGLGLNSMLLGAFPSSLGERTNSSPRCDKVTYAVFWCCVRRCIAHLACAGLMNHLHMKASTVGGSMRWVWKVRRNDGC